MTLVFGGVEVVGRVEVEDLFFHGGKREAWLKLKGNRLHQFAH